ncbi:MAG TPA: radical SAM protein [Terriglobia bacterium]|nr:radical SAM protein [Terriglobia bacterium]
MAQFRIRRKIRFAHRRLRELRMIAGGLASTDHPILAHLIPIRRCNLSCTYCNEFDDYSKPVAIPVLAHRVDLLAKLGTAVITISGGEPLLHPELEDLIRHIRWRGLMAGMITNGYLLTPARIKKLNEAGLDHLQISIDNVMPDETSKKSLKVLDQKLVMLAQYADFGININSVLGSPVRNPEDALTVARRAKALGFTSTVGILHDHSGQLLPLGENQQRIYLEVLALEKRSYSRFFSHFQQQIARGQTRQWRCRAGSRYLYICENGLVHYCSQQRGFPGVPLENYSTEQLRHEYLTQKSCAPGCTVSCVQVIGLFDNWRDPQTRQAVTGSQENLAHAVATSNERN